MELTNEFEVPVPEDEAFKLLTDLERIAPCMPGAALTSVEGDDHHGTVKVKVGPITAQYKGTARIVERDDAARTATLEAKGRDTKGQGTASALIKAKLTSTGPNQTKVSLVTDFNISGKVAQFGRGAIADVSAKLLDQFASNLEKDLAGSGAPAPAAAQPSASAAAEPETKAAEPASQPTAAQSGQSAPAAPRAITPREVEPIDLLATAGSPMIKRLAPIAGAVGLIVVVLCIRRFRRRHCRR